MRGNNDLSKHGRPPASRLLLLLALISFASGSIGYLTLDRGPWAFYAFAHLGALGLLGLFGWTAGLLAIRKQRSFWIAFAWGALLPILAGIAGVLWFWLPEGGQLYCGGAVSLAVGLLAVIAYLVAGKRALS